MKTPIIQFYTHQIKNTRTTYCGNPYISPAAELIKRADINKFTSLVSSPALSLPASTHRHAQRKCAATNADEKHTQATHSLF